MLLNQHPSSLSEATSTPGVASNLKSVVLNPVELRHAICGNARSVKDIKNSCRVLVHLRKDMAPARNRCVLRVKAHTTVDGRSPIHKPLLLITARSPSAIFGEGRLALILQLTGGSNMNAGEGYRGQIPFRPLQLTYAEQERCQELTLQLLDRTLRSYDERDATTTGAPRHTPRHHSNLDSARWKRHKTQENASLYSERDHGGRRDLHMPGDNWQSPAVLLAVGNIQTCLDDVMFGLTTQTFGDIETVGTDGGGPFPEPERHVDGGRAGLAAEHDRAPERLRDLVGIGDHHAREWGSNRVRSSATSSVATAAGASETHDQRQIDVWRTLPRATGRDGRCLHSIVRGDHGAYHGCDRDERDVDRGAGVLGGAEAIGREEAAVVYFERHEEPGK
ncbi:hypothetical protein ON010_g16328 [Phytophthora cinnamomi]|nr:hypothetical protein ON010_g16328 [Phytophthora cinnamomi]